MNVTIDDFGFSIDLTVRNEWRNIDLLRTSVQNCFIAVFADVDGCHAIAMVTGELLENALKYGNWAQSERAMFRLRVVGNEGNIEVSVQNPLKPGDTNAQQLMTSLEWINSFPNPEAAYRARMLQIAQDESGDESPSRLGLVRIAFEGNCRLTAKIEKNTVTVSAILLKDS
jgi:two-component sensor histidine kinase